METQTGVQKCRRYGIKYASLRSNWATTVSISRNGNDWNEQKNENRLLLFMNK